MADELQIHVENDLEQCHACTLPDHTGHVPYYERPDGTTVICPCKGECDGSLVWPPREPPR
jgi:hypothetical protein